MDSADFAISDLPPSTAPLIDDLSQEERYISQDLEVTCWGCGLRLLVSPCIDRSTTRLICGWCGALTDHNARKTTDHKHFRWRRFRDRIFVSVLLAFMLFVIGGGIWAVYPIVFSVSFFCGVFNLSLAVIFSVSTVVTFSLAAFRRAGTPPIIPWGSYPAVGKGGLQYYTYCFHCSKPKSPRTHHCSSCGVCVMDMDHHCPFIGNCVGAANHRSFIFFLISAVTSIVYVTIISAYSARQIWPPVYKNLDLLNGIGSFEAVFETTKELMFAFLRSMIFLSPRGFVLVYLAICSASVEIGLAVLLGQQLCYIYEGKTYLSSLSDEDEGQRDCKNFVRFFGCYRRSSRYLPNIWKSRRSPYTIRRFLPNFLNYRKRHKT